MRTFVTASPDRRQLARLADGLAAASAASLPWSSSATSILVVIWVIVLALTLDFTAIRRELSMPAGGIPVMLWLLGAAGMLWADVPPLERLNGLGAFHKFLAIPLLLAQFRRSGKANWVSIGFLASSSVLLGSSYVHALLGTKFGWSLSNPPGVPVKDYILQSEVFELCIFALAYRVTELWRSRQRQAALAMAGLALLFLCNIVYVTTGRTALAVMPLLFVLLALRQFGYKSTFMLAAVVMIVTGLAWVSSPNLRSRVSGVLDEIQVYRTEGAISSSGLRVEFWRKSLHLIAQAPVLGHGTGTVPELFSQSAAPGTGASSIASKNPHQQLLATALQLGIVGAAILLALWISHILLLWRPGFTAWCGLIVVVQDIAASQLNSHLFDFTQGWIYVFGVGVFGGTVLHARPGHPAGTESGAAARSAPAIDIAAVASPACRSTA